MTKSVNEIWRKRSNLRIFIRAAVVASLLLSGSGYASADPVFNTATPAIEEAIDALPNIRKLLDRLQNAPEIGGILTDGKNEVQDDINGYVDKIIDVILGDLYADRREELFNIDERMGEVEIELEQLRVDGLSARPSEETFSRVDQVLQRQFANGSIESIDLELDDLNSSLSVYLKTS